MHSSPAGLSQCEDFLQFQAALQEARLIDDKIIFALNNSVPTASFKGQVDAAQRCQELHNEVMATHRSRQTALADCVAHIQHKLISLQASQADPARVRPLQTTLRLYRNEMSIEEVIRSRTQSAFHERCRDHYVAPL